MTVRLKSASVNFSPVTQVARKVVFGAVLETAREMAEDVRGSIKAGGVPSPNHVPSKPGEPPNADTHELDRNVVVQEEEPLMRCSVLSRAPYAADLELGTQRIAPRPSLQPALYRAKDKLVERVASAVKSSTGG